MFYLQYPLLGSSAAFPAFIFVSMQDSSELLSRPQSSSGNLKKNGQRHVLGVKSPKCPTCSINVWTFLFAVESISYYFLNA